MVITLSVEINWQTFSFVCERFPCESIKVDLSWLNSNIPGEENGSISSLLPGDLVKEQGMCIKSGRGGRGWKRDNEPEDVTDVLKGFRRKKGSWVDWRKLFWLRKKSSLVKIFFNVRWFCFLMSSLPLGSQQ